MKHFITILTHGIVGALWWNWTGESLHVTLYMIMGYLLLTKYDQ